MLIGRISTSGGSEIRFDDSNIIKDSVSINSQCVNGSDFEYGAVYAAEMAFSFVADVDRYTLYNAKVTSSYYLDVNGTWEEVPLGVYYINEPVRKGSIIAVKALDGFTLLDEPVDEEVFGTPYELLSHVAGKCKVELAQTENEIRTFTNGEKVFTLIPDRLDTYRDVVAYIAMLLCGFAVFDRYGKLKIVSYALEPSREIGPSQRYNASFSDFTTYYSGVMARFIAEENYAPYEYVDPDIQGGLILDMGDIPIVQGLPEFKHQLMQDIFTSLRNIRYVPCSITYTGDPSIDLGDLVTNIGVKGIDVQSYITKYNWKYRGMESLGCAGGNPKLNSVKDKTRKQLQSFEADITARDIIAYTYTNIKEFTITEIQQEIIAINYATVTSAKPIFIATVQFELNLDGNVEFRYYLDDREMENTMLTKYYNRGKHFSTFSMYLDDDANVRHKLSVKACTGYVESEARILAAKTATIYNFMDTVTKQNKLVVDALADQSAVLPITTLSNTLEWEESPIDITVPVMRILKQDIKAVLFAQGLAGTSRWDGTLNLQEAIGVAIPGIDVSLIAEVGIDKYTPGTSMFTEAIGITIPGIPTDFIETIVLTKVYVQDIFSTKTKELCEYDSIHVRTDQEVFELRTDYIFVSHETTVDTGRMMRVQLITDGMQSIDELGWR